MSATYIDIHVLQSVPPSNINRDDTGTPKNAFYGGVQRARVSSQAWKKATRQDFSQHLEASHLALRTKRAVQQITERLVATHALEHEDATNRAVEAITLLGFKLEKGRTKKDDTAEANLTEYLTFFSNAQLDRFAEIAAAAAPGEKLDKKALTEAARAQHGIEVALFGRMVADDKQLNVDAACQVAHAISTHAATVEHDYYTAVDDKAPADNAGAGMLGTVEFTSATFYRYATIAIDQLITNLGSEEAALTATKAFIDAFVRSMPTGKQNTFANHTPVDAVLVQVRKAPTNFIGAFEEAVTSASGYVEPSAQALADYAHEVETQYAGKPLASFVVRVSPKAKSLDDLGTRSTLDELGSAVTAHMSHRTESGDA
ncbi:CRISPR-associated protein Cas7/Cse4/CasC, subtype I-E/ECOLI [Dermatophilus congolensis]|uniref:CRISPR-associated protein Cas7/Cse4/CasC, subtype I-E/ECOLI n=1 Tax=Dermatophilus congolensis TaxID=1863 RepID=A0A239VH12_9MICO|nr:type I-E CRISPR-associated protein Cas7/Cse4/CasC [Dermatophilus congolensis]SNV21591.1 CRISPR-associated protein Cas7/Cse4/CasC, subtype I-E/ECOLI [Dermatophilus congolensis]